MISLENRLAIYELIARYAHCCDNYRSEEWAAMFVKDGILGFGPNPMVGQQAIADKSDALREGPTEYRHVITNIYLDDQATNVRATARAYGTVMDWATQPPRIAIFADYRFEVVFEDGRWKFAFVEVGLPYSS